MNWYPSKRPSQLLPCPVCNGTKEVKDAKTGEKRPCSACCGRGKYLTK